MNTNQNDAQEVVARTHNWKQRLEKDKRIKNARHRSYIQQYQSPVKIDLHYSFQNDTSLDQELLMLMFGLVGSNG